MKYVEIITDPGNIDTVKAISERLEIRDVRLGAIGEDGLQSSRLLVSDQKLQPTLDALQQALGTQSSTRIVVLAIEAFLPKPGVTANGKKDVVTISRESIYQDVEKGARLDTNFIVLVVLSTIVAAIGLLEDNVAVVIGAMVIAPLLGPNLALSLGTALGDVVLMRTALKTFIVGILIALSLSILFALVWPSTEISSELMSRTKVNLGSVALALASGAAATLSLTTGLSSVLVGVMVAVALLPPAVTFGLMLGNWHLDLAIGSGLLLAINIVCVNLASKTVFFIKNVRPRTWYEMAKAKQAMRRYIIGWIITLAALLFFIYLRGL